MAAVEKIPLLKSVPLFSGLDDAELHTLFDHASVRSFPKNSVIINDGDESDSLYVIASGKVKIFLMDDKGKEIILNFQSVGEYFGELSLLDQVCRSASVITLEPCQFIVISRMAFMHCISQHPEVALRVIRDLTARLRDLTDEVKGFALLDVYGRLSRILLKLAEPKNGELVIERAPPRKDLASMVGSSREMVTRIIKALEEGGHITINGKTIVIHGQLPYAW
ncbi:MAG: cyclic nucleotide-binding domain-containing protein [Candidatus Polarisedimenticolaceae bacterium]|nr:cyclic nucleotide-binding domain-containing protein [Candidatus Polarisedimenticolaceae bacterium]